MKTVCMLMLGMALQMLDSDKDKLAKKMGGSLLLKYSRT